MKLEDTLVHRQGILRCCVATIVSVAEEEGPTKDYSDGAVIYCKFSKGNRAHKLMLLNSVWRWTDPETVVAQEREKLRKAGKLYSHVRGRDLD